MNGIDWTDLDATELPDRVPQDYWRTDDVPSFGKLPTHAQDADLTLY